VPQDQRQAGRDQHHSGARDAAHSLPVRERKSAKNCFAKKLSENSYVTNLLGSCFQGKVLFWTIHGYCFVV
jgi:hypothetical protein